jgi:hypothetical protein
MITIVMGQPRYKTLTDVLNTLNNIQNQNAKGNEELGAKLMTENQK